MENNLYFCDTADEANATNEAILIPQSRVLGLYPGVVAGTTGDNMTLFFQSLSNTGAARGSILFAIANGKFIEASNDLVAAMNSTPGDGFVTIADVKNGIFCSNHITGITINTEV